MKKLTLVAWISWAVLLVSGCHPISIKTDYDRNANFPALQTYAWREGASLNTGDPRFDTDQIDRYIRTTVESTLAAKGFRKSDSGKPDFVIDYGGGLTSGESSVTRGRRFDDTKGISGFVGTSSVDYESGSLVLEMSDPSTNQMLWRGSASAVVAQLNSAAERRERIRKAVQKMLEKFPPR